MHYLSHDQAGPFHAILEKGQWDYLRIINILGNLKNLKS
jgi:hypothetical protein